MERFGTAPAPGRLARIQALVNTALTRRAGEPRHDLLATVTAAQGWLDGLLAGVDAEPVTLTEADLLVLRDLREGIRVALRASAPNIAEAADQASLVRAEADVHFTFSSGTVSCRPAGSGADAVTGMIAVDWLVAQETGLLSRLKTCASPACGVCFFDASPNRVRVWHDTKKCGMPSRCRA
jgi:predicted RNA-binding Zn ribbon-like protein